MRGGSGEPPIRYPAVGQCLRTLGDRAIELQASVHMPRIGCGLAGRRWDQIEPLIEAGLSQRGVAVTIYDFEPWCVLQADDAVRMELSCGKTPDGHWHGWHSVKIRGDELRRLGLQPDRGHRTSPGT